MKSLPDAQKTTVPPSKDASSKQAKPTPTPKSNSATAGPTERKRATEDLGAGRNAPKTPRKTNAKPRILPKIDELSDPQMAFRRGAQWALNRVRESLSGVALNEFQRSEREHAILRSLVNTSYAAAQREYESGSDNVRAMMSKGERKLKDPTTILKMGRLARRTAQVSQS